MKGYEVVARTLVDNDVEATFSYISEDTKSILAELSSNWQSELTAIETRHEQHAVAMADGYARTRDAVGVCIIGRGPGIAQTGTALRTAAARGSPVLIIVAEPAMSATDDLKAYRQESYLESLLERVVSIRSQETLPEVLPDAIRDLRHGAGPIALQLPYDVITASVPVPPDWDPVPETTEGAAVPANPLEPRAEVIDRVVDAYLDSGAGDPPVVLAGRGAVHSGAKADLEALAARTGAVLTTTLQAKDFFADHRFGCGIAGTLGTRLANTLLAQTNFVFAVGCSLNKHTTDNGRLLEDATVVHVDRSPSQIGRNANVDYGVIGDASAATRAVVERLDAEDVDFQDAFWTSSLERRVADHDPLEGRSFEVTPDRIDPRVLVRKLEPLLPTNRLVVTDAGHFVDWVLDGISVPTPEQFVWTLDFAAVGLGLPIGIGAAIANPDTPCVVFCGDGGFMMALQEIDTAVRADVPVTVVVFNDEGLGAEYHQLDLQGKPTAPAEVPAPDIAGVAEKLGAASHTVRRPEDVEAISAALSTSPDGPQVIECKVDPNVRHRFFDSFEGGAKGM